DVESAQSGDDHKVWKDKGPAADPGTPKTAAQVRNMNSNLNGERSRQRLAYGNGFTHLLFGQPAALGDEFTLHLADQRNRTAETQQSEPGKIQNQLGQRATFYCRLHCHRFPRRWCEIGSRFEVLSPMSPQLALTILHWPSCPARHAVHERA